MLAVIDSGAFDPAKIAKENEGREENDDHRDVEPADVLQRRYLEGASANERARFHRLNPANREHELAAWNATGMRGYLTSAARALATHHQSPA